MNILLINPPQKRVYGKMISPDHPPLGLAYIGAVLEREGHSVKIIDIDADNISKSKLLFQAKNHDLVGITATTPTFKAAEETCRLIKENMDKQTVLGGIHATITPDECIKSPYFDFVVRGEGEETIIELVNAFGEEKKFSLIKGLSFKNNKKIIHNPPRELMKDLDLLPFPSRHLFNHQKYTYPDSYLKPVMPLISSRGCPHGCTYCCTKLLFSRKVRFRSAKNVVDEIEELIKQYGVKEIHFWDDNFTLNKKRVKEIRDEIIKRRIKLKFSFPNGLRVDQVDEQILQWLKDMGAYSVAFGVESGNQEILDNVEKGITLEKVEKAFSIAKLMGFETWAFFMIGLPGDTKETINKTVQFAKKINPDVAKFHILKPFPGTKVFDQLKKEGLITEFDYSKYGIHTRPVHRLPGLTEEDLLEESKKAYRSFYLRTTKIISHILRMKSFERFKTNLKTGIGLLTTIK